MYIVVYGNLDGFSHGDRVRVIGIFTPAGSFCMVGVCCLVADTTTECVGCCQNRSNFFDLVGVGGIIDTSDLVALVAYLFIEGSRPECAEEANVDGQTGPSGPIDVSDLTYLVAYMFKGGAAPPPCP
ncbi:MAG: hypothetical protein KOO62_08915 [candidate division Zixibacteria bacterium]|nr:hypothetical protein [candidate division Zixibacteria bacterium]